MQVKTPIQSAANGISIPHIHTLIKLLDQDRIINFYFGKLDLKSISKM